MRSVTSSYKSWTGFLRAACYNYKCPFDEQILIYAQRPDATAVLEMERWNRQFGRWVNRGAKSIAVFGDDGQHLLKLYFDVSDTHESRFSRPLPIWTMQPAFEPAVCMTYWIAARTVCWKNWTTSIWRYSTGMHWKSACPICY